MRDFPLDVTDSDETSLPAGDSAWDRCGWLDVVRDVPGEGTWPRLMTSPHPLAVGSYGSELIAGAEVVSGKPLRWWQRLVVLRLLEHDADGGLVWLVALLSLARQLGKSWLLRELCWWRMHQAERFGEPQQVLHTGKELAVCAKVQQPARSWARAHKSDGYKAREVNGQQEISRADGSAWLIRSQLGVFGSTSALAVVDEAWDVPAFIVDEGVEPTQPERVAPQLVLVSTAHRKATSLMLGRRRDALVSLRSPADVLLVEWSAPRSADVGDPGAWRAASPEWSPLREQMLASRLRRASQGGSGDVSEPDPLELFRGQYLNVWPTATAAVGKDESLLEDGVWAGMADPTVPPPAGLVVAVEDRTGLGAAAAAAGALPDGRLLVWGVLFRDRRSAFGWAELLGPARLLVGASLAEDEALGSWRDRGLPVVKVGATETGAALPKLRELAAAGRIVHDGGAQLAAQVAGLRVAERVGGLAVTSVGRSDLVRCAAWAVRDAAAAPAVLEDAAVF